jgi:hypothetical protein
MSIVLNNVTTTNEYPVEGSTGGPMTAYRTFGPMALAQINVYNAAVYMQVLTQERGESGQAIWQPEEFRAPSEYTIIRRYILGIRFRSAKEETPAQVSAVLIPEQETWLAVLASGVAA